MDQIRIEGRGIPTVTIATSEFIDLARQTMVGSGISDMAFVVVPHPLGALGADAVRAKADAAFSAITRAATDWKPSATQLTLIKPAYPSERIKIEGTVEDVSKIFFEKGWSLGLPIVPPTPDRVEKMLKGTSRRPDEVVWPKVPPQGGILTVELVAVHAVMAGARPDYMPVIIAALEAMADPKYDWKGAATTTGTIGPMVLVNGPIVKEIGLAYAQGAAGPGHHANLAIGYTISLIGDVVGGSVVGIDQSTFGSPADTIVWVFGENEDANPWNSYSVEHGFKPTDSVVTVKNVYPTIDVPDHSSETAEQHLSWWVQTLNPMIGQPYCLPYGEYYLVFCPEWAETLAKAGWTKDRIRKYLWENARLPYSAWPRKACRPKGVTYGPNDPVPITQEPGQLKIVVAGGAGKHSQYFIGAKGYAVSKLIKK